MELIPIIISGLALLAASVCLILLVQEKKRSEKQRAVSLSETAKSYQEDLRYREAVSEEMGKMLKRIEDLEKGIIPDYNEAIEAKNAVDNFSRDIANLLNFDPLAAAKDARTRRRHGGEVIE